MGQKGDQGAFFVRFVYDHLRHVAHYIAVFCLAVLAVSSLDSSRFSVPGDLNRFNLLAAARDAKLWLASGVSPYFPYSVGCCAFT